MSQSIAIDGLRSSDDVVAAEIDAILDPTGVGGHDIGAGRSGEFGDRLVNGRPGSASPDNQRTAGKLASRLREGFVGAE